MTTINNPNPILLFKNVSLSLLNVTMPILSDINYNIYSGDFVVILGVNGSGKSSLLKLISRQYQLTDGKIFLKNKNILNLPQTYLNKKIGILTQNYNDSVFTDLTVFENYILFSRKSATTKNRYIFSEFLKDFNPVLAEKLDQLVDVLSGGEKQALALALRFIDPPDILLLDEHTSALDPKTSSQIMMLTNHLIKQYKITCLLTTHNLEIATQYGNRILALKQGKIHHMLDHPPRDALDTQALLTACF